MRRYRRFVRRRRQRRTTWMYAANTNSSPASAGLGNNTEDLLTQYRTAAGITLNLPKITIRRVVIKISIRIDISTAAFASQSGFYFGLHVDANNFGVQPSADPYRAHWMWKEVTFAGEEQANTLVSSAVGDILLVKKFDVKSSRRIDNDFDTLLLEIQPYAGTKIVEYSYDAQILASV